MKVLVLGATGATGRQIVEQALAQGHQVTAFVRDPAKLAISHPALRVVQGSLPEDAQALAGALPGQDAVLSSLGMHNALRSHGLQQRSMQVLVPAME
jgi:putative NADH-flavin reductase